MAIKINLLPREDRPKRAGMSMPKMPTLGGGKAVQQGAAALLVLVLLGTGAFWYMAWNEKATLQKDLASLKAQDDALKRQLFELRLVEDAKREIQRRLGIIGRVAKSQGVPVETMNGVLKAVPQGIWLTSLEMRPQEVRVTVPANRPAISYTSETLAKLDEKKQATATQAPKETKQVTEIQGYSVLLKGLAFNNFQVADFMDNLKKLGVFSDVDFTVTQSATVEQVRVMSFEVTATVKL